MLNYLWSGMLICSFIVAIFNNKMMDVSNSIAIASKSSIELCLSLLGAMCFWTGIMRIGNSSGLVDEISKIFMPFLKNIFPEVPKEHSAFGFIVMNCVSNFLGLGNASTSLGIKAMNELQKINKDKNTATNAMCMFITINSAMVQIIPTTVIALRAAAGSNNPSEIISATWIAGVSGLFVGIILVRILSMVWKN